MAVNGIEIKSNQKWMTKAGVKGVIKKQEDYFDSTYPWVFMDEDGFTWAYTDEGLYCEYATTTRDLVTLIEDSHKFLSEN